MTARGTQARPWTADDLERISTMVRPRHHRRGLIEAGSNDAGHPLGWPDPQREAADAALAILAAAGTSRDDLTTEDWRRIVAGCFG